MPEIMAINNIKFKSFHAKLSYSKFYVFSNALFHTKTEAINHAMHRNENKNSLTQSRRAVKLLNGHLQLLETTDIIIVVIC